MWSWWVAIKRRRWISRPTTPVSRSSTAISSYIWTLALWLFSIMRNKKTSRLLFVAIFAKKRGFPVGQFRKALGRRRNGNASVVPVPTVPRLAREDSSFWMFQGVAKIIVGKVLHGHTDVLVRSSGHQVGKKYPGCFQGFFRRVEPDDVFSQFAEFCWIAHFRPPLAAFSASAAVPA